MRIVTTSTLRGRAAGSGPRSTLHFTEVNEVPRAINQQRGAAAAAATRKRAGRWGGRKLRGRVVWRKGEGVAGENGGGDGSGSGSSGSTNGDKAKPP